MDLWVFHGFPCVFHADVPPGLGFFHGFPQVSQCSSPGFAGDCRLVAGLLIRKRRNGWLRYCCCYRVDALTSQSTPWLVVQARLGDHSVPRPLLGVLGAAPRGSRRTGGATSVGEAAGSEGR